MDDSGGLRLPPRHVAELSDFFAAHARWLFGHACVRTRGDRELAADLVQDTFEAAARSWATLRGHANGRQRAWLLGTLTNKDVSDFRRREALRRRQPDIHARYQATAADTAAEALNAIALERAGEIIEGMPPRQRACALMRWQDRMRVAEIAAALGIAEGTVHAHLHAARGKLAAGLAGHYPCGQDDAKPDEKPDDKKPDNGKPDNGKPDNGKPDNGKPDNGKPDNGKPDNGKGAAS